MPGKQNVIVLGATGMVGEGVLHTCLKDDRVGSVLVIGRRPSGMHHPKMKEVVHTDLLNPAALQPHVNGYDACFFCMGVSSVGMSEQDYTAVTHDLTLAFARMLHAVNPALTFCYISGSGTDSSEKGRSMWARVKGKTENALLGLFKNAYMFRPGYMRPIKGMKNTLKFYRYVDWMYPAFRLLMPGFMGTLAELANAMIFVATKGYDKRILELKDIRKCAGTDSK